MLGIHDVCCRNCGTATCKAQQVTAKNGHIYIYAWTRTRSGLAVDKNAPALVKFSFYKCYRGNQMLEHVRFLHVVQGNLVPNEGLRSP